MAFELQLIDLAADCEELVRIITSSTNEQEPFKTMYKDASPEDIFTFTYHIFNGRMAQPGAVTFKIVETFTKKIVSVFIVQRPYTMTAEDKLAMPTTPELPPGTNMKLASEFLSIAFGIRKRHGYDSEKDYMGGIIATLREYQGQGHAMRLLHEGIKMADRDHGKWYAGCWPASAPLYGKVKGFEYVAEESIDMSQYGGSSPISMRLFIREPQDADMSI